MVQIKPTFLRCFCLVVAALACIGEAAAQAYPNRIIKVINPWAPGGVADTLMRPINDGLAAALGQPVILENRPGANGTIGSAVVAKAPPDGYTLLMSHFGPMIISPNMQGFSAYDPIKDFEPVTLLVRSSVVLVVRNDLPVNSVKELIDYGKAHPGKLNLASVGAGSPPHLAAEMMRMMAGVEYLHVPYKGNVPAATDLIAGRVDYTFLAMDGMKPFIQAGKLRALAMTSLNRYSLAPELPTVSETLPGFELASWFAVHAPAGTPKQIVDRLSREIQRIVRSPEISEKLRRLYFQPAGTTPEELATTQREDLARWGKVVKAAGMTFQ